MLKGKAMLGLVGMAWLAVSVSAFAEEPPYATYDIRLENTLAQTKAEAVTEHRTTKDNVAFHIQNNTGKAVYFVNGSDKEYIPVVSNRTVIAPYSRDAYQVVDAKGETVATWKLDAGVVEQSRISGASKEQFAQWGAQIQQVIESARNRTYAYAGKPEPVATSTKAVPAAVEKNTVIRGYW